MNTKEEMSQEEIDAAVTSRRTSRRITPGEVRILMEVCFGVAAYRRADYESGERWSADYTGENRAAHGCIARLEEESAEGRRRWVCVNGRHWEAGPWSAPRPRAGWSSE